MMVNCSMTVVNRHHHPPVMQDDNSAEGSCSQRHWWWTELGYLALILASELLFLTFSLYGSLASSWYLGLIPIGVVWISVFILILVKAFRNGSVWQVLIGIWGISMAAFFIALVCTVRKDGSDFVMGSIITLAILTTLLLMLVKCVVRRGDGTGELWFVYERPTASLAHFPRDNDIEMSRPAPSLIQSQPRPTSAQIEVDAVLTDVRKEIEAKPKPLPRPYQPLIAKPQVYKSSSKNRNSDQ